ncbi:MAG: transposase, partial [Candidatus Cloacimonetes bacterium]|nr:transposase [Candidatus Cloacimonadota bacterium]
MIIDGDGFVIRHKVFNGKMSDADSLKEILLTIQADYANVEEKPTIIFDRGITSDENIKLLKSPDFKFKYIIASRNNTENAN